MFITKPKIFKEISLVLNFKISLKFLIGRKKTRNQKGKAKIAI